MENPSVLTSCYPRAQDFLNEELIWKLKNLLLRIRLETVDIPDHLKAEIDNIVGKQKQ